MGVQTTYEAELTAAQEGQRVDLGLINIISRVVEDAAGIQFGRAVVRGTDESQCQLPSAAGEDFLGITQYTSAWTQDNDGLHEYTQYREANIIDFGMIWVSPEVSVVPGEPVYYRHTATGSEEYGALRNDDDSGDATLIVGATFESTASAAGIAIVRLMPNVNGLDIFEDFTAVSGAISLLTEATLFDSTLGSIAATLADGYEGQVKIVKLVVDGGNVVITPANYTDGTALTLNDANDAAVLKFLDGAWALVSELDSDTYLATFEDVTATSGALSLIALVSLLDTTLGASTATLADGYEGQRKIIKMTVDGGDSVLTPANYFDGTTITFTAVNDVVELMFIDATWHKVTGTFASIAANIIVATSGAITLGNLVSLFDTTAGISTATLADGSDNQRKILKMKVDGGDQVVTPANFFDGTTITFDDVNDSIELVFVDSAWQTVGTPTATVA